MPLFYPALYVTVHMRGRSLAVNTIQNALNALKAMYAWQSYYSIDVELRFSCGELLQSHEVHSLRDFMQKPLTDENDGNVVSISRRPKTVSTTNQYARMSVIADYLGFLADQLLSPSTSGCEGIARMVAQIKANRPRTSNKSNVSREVIPPFLILARTRTRTRTRSRGQATRANFCLGVMPPSAMFGRL